MLKVILSQLDFSVGDLDANRGKIIANIDRARAGKADILVFPELALCGYPPEDLLFKPYFIAENKKQLGIIAKRVKGLCVIAGFVDAVKTGKYFSRYNAAAVLQDGKVAGIYHKICLPNYGVFDEKRYFTRGDSIPLFMLGKYRFALSVCEDIWVDWFTNYFSQGSPAGKVDFMVNISASPFYLGKIDSRKKILSRAAKIMNAYVFYCNVVGGQDEIVFDGRSMVYSPQGKMIAQGARFKEDFMVFTLDKGRKCIPVHDEQNDVDDVYQALILGLRDYARKSGFMKVVVGVSGGIDSAVVLALAVDALGKDNVIGVIMPSRYTSKGAFADAKKICRNLGVENCIIDIDGIFHSYGGSVKKHFKGIKSDKTEENLQARIRGSLLMAFSNKFGYMVLNTGNKSEVSCGYCTLYGDMVGGFGVLKDVYKTLVYKLARRINRNSEVIPLSIIMRPPSAELKPNQRDQDTLPPYPVLDEILKYYIEEDLSLTEIVRRGFQKRMVKKVIEMVDKNEYKRRQAPPGIKITPRAFGKDRRMPIVNKFLYK